MNLATPFADCPPGAVVIDTDVGPIAVAWTERGIDRLLLSDRRRQDRDDLAAGLAAEMPERPLRKRPPAPVAAVLKRLRRHLAGKPDNLLDVPVDLAGVSAFAVEVLDALRQVLPGQTVTYGELGARAGRPRAARAVGRIMGSNPVPLIVPCHRCLPADPRQNLGGFSSPGGSATKAHLLFVEGVQLDPEAAAGIAFLRRRDPVMRRAISHVGPYLPRAARPASLWDVLVRAIIHQQISVAAGRTITGRVAALTPGDDLPTAAELLTLDAEILRGAGCSGQKQGYLRDLAARVEDGRLRLSILRRLDDETAIQELTQVKGIGRWSAQMVLMFHLGRLDVLPVDDLGLRNAAQRAYGLDAVPTPAEMETLGERWRPYRSLASWYLWQVMDLGGL